MNGINGGEERGWQHTWHENMEGRKGYGCYEKGGSAYHFADMRKALPNVNLVMAWKNDNIHSRGSGKKEGDGTGGGGDMGGGVSVPLCSFTCYLLPVGWSGDSGGDTAAFPT